MDELLQYFQSLLSYAETQGQNLNIASQQALAQFIAQFQEFLIEHQNRLQTTISAPTPPISPGMPSSNVAGSAYDDENKRLFVQFLGKYPDRNGPVYSYENVPPVIVDLLQSGAIPARTKGKNKWGEWWPGKIPSLGASLFTLIKNGGYNYSRLT